MMITRANVSRSARRLGLVHRSHACTIWRQIQRSGCSVASRRPNRPQEGTVSGRGSDAVQCPDIRSTDLGCLEGVLIRRSIPISRVLTCPESFGGEGCKKERRDECLFPITLPVTSVLGGKAAGAFKAPALVRASGGGQRPCARRLLIRSSLFPYSTVVSTRPLSGSLDAFSVFEAAVVVDRMCMTRASSWGPRPLCGQSRYMHR
jgi:hypothetical protein